MTKFFSELDIARMTVDTEGVSCSTVRRAYAGKPVSPALYNLITGAARKLGFPAPPPLVPRKRRAPRAPKLANPLHQHPPPSHRPSNRTGGPRFVQPTKEGRLRLPRSR